MYLFMSHLLFFLLFFLKGLRLIYLSKIQCMYNLKTDLLTKSIAENGNVSLFILPNHDLIKFLSKKHFCDMHEFFFIILKRIR